jgi:hypothetical protein
MPPEDKFRSNARSPRFSGEEALGFSGGSTNTETGNIEPASFTDVAGAQAFRLSGTSPAVQTATATRANSTTDRGVVCTATGDANGAVGDLVGVHYTADAELVA